MKDKVAARLMDEVTQKLSKEGRQVLMVADEFETPDGKDTLTSIEVSRKGNGVIGMLIDLMKNIYEPRGIYFSTAYEFLGREAEARGLLNEKVEVDDPAFEVIVKKNGKEIASIGFEEEETAYEVLREAGFSASETRDALGL